MKLYYKNAVLYIVIIIAVLFAIYNLINLKKEQFSVMMGTDKKATTLARLHPKCNINKPIYADCHCNVDNVKGNVKEKYVYVNDNYNKIAKCKERDVKIATSGKYPHTEKKYMWGSLVDNIVTSTKNYTSCDPIKGGKCVPNSNACLSKNNNFQFSTWSCKDKKWVAK